MRVEQRCNKCGTDYMYVIDVVQINGNEVEFLACFQCLVGYTRAEKDIERIV